MMLRRFVWVAFFTAMGIFALAFVLMPGEEPARAGNSPIAGDASCDGSVNAVDSLQVLRFVAGLSSADCVETNGDVDCSAAVNAIDSLKILRWVAGLPVDLPGGCPPIGGGGTPGPTPTPPPEEPPITSFTLIEEALADGELNAEEALTYKVFAAFGDNRLPAQYSGDDETLGDTLVLLDLAEAFGSLSAEGQQALGPFLIPPDQPGSWVELGLGGTEPLFQRQIQGWSNVATANGKVKVWWQDRYASTDRDKARAVAEAIDNVIWPKLTQLMGREPYDDNGSSTTGRGDDDRIDIRLVDMTSAGEATMFTPGCKNSPGYILLNRTHGGLLPGANSTTAHELMHLIQFTYSVVQGCVHREYRWLMESTATWAKDYVYPDVQDEHRFASSFMTTPEKPLETTNTPPRHYGAYLFFQYLARGFSPQHIREAWELTEGVGQLDAVSNVLDGGFEEQWPRFANSLWNQPPVDDFKRWDRLSQTPNVDTTIEVAPGPSGNRRYELDIEVEHLGIKYARLKFTSPNTRSFAFYNGHNFNLVEQDFGVGALLLGQGASPEETKGAHIWAIAKINGQWQEPEDWTGLPVKSFCREVPSQRLDELILVFTNSEYKDTSHHTMTPGLPTTVWSSNMACKSWRGRASIEVHGAGTTMWQFNHEDVVFEWDPAAGDQQFGIAYNYVATGGTVNFTASGSVEGCVLSGSEEGIALTDQSFFNTSNYYVSGLYHRAATGVLFAEGTAPHRLQCPDSEPDESEYTVDISLYPLDPSGIPTVEPPKVSADGTMLDVQFHVDFDGGGTFDAEWHFESDSGGGVGVSAASPDPPP